ncbi:IS30 family transposase [Streptomyces achromogenes]|uniref:IS30 family transposase n=1 Tax=Streptomyces achromogenes TaxID=67255 RepID=UPI00369644D6
MHFEIRKDKQTRTAKLRREREAYFRLMKLGYSNREASKLVGINVRTGREWRNGRPEGRKKRPRSPAHIVRATSGAPSRFLTETERIHIADRVREKATIRATAAELGRNPSTISREIRRNRSILPNGHWYYRPYAAQRRADARRSRPKPGRIAQNPELRHFVQDHLAKRWSPAQICHALRKAFPGRPKMHVVHETIYQALYAQDRGGLRRELTRALRSGRTRRRPHRQGAKRQPRFTGNMLMISDRPAEAADRAVLGHWEGDLIIGARHKSAIGTSCSSTCRTATRPSTSTRPWPSPSSPCRPICDGR